MEHPLPRAAYYGFPDVLNDCKQMESPERLSIGEQVAPGGSKVACETDDANADMEDQAVVGGGAVVRRGSHRRIAGE